jgi:uncharacterized protein
MQTTLNDLTVLFLGILLEALPFVMLGSVIASVISFFVSDNLLYRLIPKNRIGGLLAASLLGIVFPVCDCTVIPIMRRLIKKGLPPSLAVTFMCAVPIVNPAVIASTFWAFTTEPRMIWLRLIVGMWTAIAAGFVIGKLTRESNPLLDDKENINAVAISGCSCGGHSHDPTINSVHQTRSSPDAHSADENNGCICGNHECQPAHSGNISRWRKITSKINPFLIHTKGEFIDSAALIVIGAFLSAVMQMLVPRTIMYPLSTSPVSSVGVMMVFTYLISLCSNADAFVAKSFYGLFTTGSVVAFMTFGQMIDLKNTIVLIGFFKKRFIVITITVIAIVCFSWGLAINVLGRGL